MNPRTAGRSKRPQDYKRPTAQRMRETEREYYRVPELASKLGLTSHALWAQIRKGVLPSVKLGGAILVKKSEFERIIQENTRAAIEGPKRGELK